MFRNSNGDVSIYSFCCGYIQQFKNDQFDLKLYKDGCYHLQVGGIWLSCNRITPLRYIYKCIENKMNNGLINEDYINGWKDEVGLYA